MQIEVVVIFLKVVIWSSYKCLVAHLTKLTKLIDKVYKSNSIILIDKQINQWELRMFILIDTGIVWMDVM